MVRFVFSKDYCRGYYWRQGGKAANGLLQNSGKEKTGVSFRQLEVMMEWQTDTKKYSRGRIKKIFISN